jgi:hypothetical protein
MKFKMFGEQTEVGPEWTVKQATFKPEEKNTLVRYRQIEEYVTKLEAKMPEGTKIVVRAENMSRLTTMYSTYKKKKGWLTNDEELNYAGGQADIADKLLKYFNFTITIYEPTKVKNMFLK